MERRINPKTGRTEIKLQPPGLPAIWVDEGYCERCEPYGECLGLMELSNEEWETAQQLIIETQKDNVHQELSQAGFNLKPCK